MPLTPHVAVQERASSVSTEVRVAHGYCIDTCHKSSNLATPRDAAERGTKDCSIAASVSPFRTMSVLTNEYTDC